VIFWSVASASEVPALDDGAPRGEPHAADAALVVANEDYAFLPDVPFAGRDGDAVAHTLVATRGIPRERVRVLHGANREQLLDAFDSVVGQVGAEGTVWLYFAGHGAASPSTTEPLLVGDDAKREASVFAARSVALSELRARAGERPLVLVTDACFTGASRTGEALVPGARFAVPSWALPEARAQWVATAAGPDQTAGPYDPARHGLFTWLFTGALRGWADGSAGGEPDGRVTTGEVDAFVGRALATLDVHDQSPVFTGPPDTVLVSSTSLERAPDLSALPRPGGGPVAGPSRPAPTGGVARIAGRSWTIQGEPATYGQVQALALRDPVGANAVRRSAIIPFAHVGAGYTLLAGTAVTATMAALAATADPDDPKGLYGGMAVFGGALLAGGVGWEVWLGHRSKQHRQTIAAAAERTLAREP
jgi:hypothetical protein